MDVNAESNMVSLQVEYPESFSRGLLLLKVFLGWLYVGIPNGIILILRFIVVILILIGAWFAVPFTGNYPASWHKFVVDTIRWNRSLEELFFPSHSD